MAARKNISFEESMKKLEQIVSTLEQGDISLEKSMALFEEGSKLSAALSKQLDMAEQQVVLMLRKQEDAPLVETPFSAEES